MFGLLANPKNLLIVALIGAIVFLGFAYQGQKIKRLTCETDLVESQAVVEALKVDRDAKEIQANACAENLKEIRSANDRMRDIVNSSNERIRRLLAADAERKPLPAGACDCPAIRIEGIYEKELTDVIDSFRYRVRGKVRHPESGSDTGPSKVLSPANPT